MIRTFAALAAVLTVGAVQAADMNMDMSDYIRKCTVLSNSKNICGSLPQIVCQVQDILNYILEAYDNDPVLEQEVDELWEKL